jgi:HSP20 family protein
VLTIKGEKQEEREERKKGYHMRERSFGPFELTFQVAEGIDVDRITVSFKKGCAYSNSAEDCGGTQG